VPNEARRAQAPVEGNMTEAAEVPRIGIALWLITMEADGA